MNEKGKQTNKQKKKKKFAIFIKAEKRHRNIDTQARRNRHFTRKQITSFFFVVEKNGSGCWGWKERREGGFFS